MLRLARLLAVVLVVCLPASAALAQAVPGAPAAEPTSAPPALSPDEAARALIRVLDDEAARSRLIGELGRIAAEAPPAGPPAGAAAPTDADPAAPAAPSVGKPPAAEPSIASRLGLYTETLARDVTEIVKRVWIRLSHVAGLATGAATIDWAEARQHGQALAILCVVGFGALWLARLVARWPLARLSAAAAGRSAGMKVVLNAVRAALELACLAAATAVLHLAIAGLEASPLASPVVSGVFVDAFTLVETIKILLRLVFSPQRPELRLLPAGDAAARYWRFRLARFADLLGYGVIIGVPLVTATVSFAVALGVRMLFACTALAAFITLAIVNRTSVRAGMMEVAGRTRSVALTTLLTLLAPVWHVVAIAYALVAFGIWITRPLDAIGFMVAATAQSVVTILVGGALMAFVSRAIEGGVRLPADMRAALPLLEHRLNLLVPTALRILRVAMGGIIVAGVLHAWQIVDVFAWAGTDRGAELISRIVAAGFILLVAVSVWIAATAWIEYRLRPTAGRVSTPRARTLLSLFRNALTIVITIIGVMLALSELGVDIAPLIAGAGVLGLAVGFGSQKLVQDIITGAFIQFENAMNEGDVVTVAGISGVVEKLTIRSVGLRDANGVYHVIPFSSVDLVSNAMRGFAFHVAELKVSAGDDVEEVKLLMQRAFDDLMAGEHRASILEPLEMQGIVGFLEGAVMVRARIKTLPGQQWTVGRAYNERIKAVFDSRGISMPAPPVRVWINEPRPQHRPPGADEAAAAAPAKA